MRTFLWFMIVMFSGDGESVDVTTFLDEDVLLPCNCTNRDSKEKPRWQTEGNEPELVWFNNSSTNYTGRVETFFNTNNCSILLKNVKINDHKEYRCWFYVKNTYQYELVNLRVCGPEPCQQNFTQPNGVQVSMCDVKSRDNTTELQWTLDGKSLKNSNEYKISSSSTQTDGIFHITSTLEMNLTETNASSVIKCKVTSSSESTAERLKPLVHTTVNIPALVVVLVLVTGLILLVFFILLRRKQMNMSLTEPHYSTDVEKSCFWNRAYSEGDQNEKQVKPPKVEVI